MKITYKQSFRQRFNAHLDFIAKDNLAQSKRFRDTLKTKIESIKTSPYQCRKSIWFEDDSIRDLIYQDHTIIYRVKKNVIEVFGFVSYQENPFDEK